MADFDMNSLLGQQSVPGLLSDEQQGNANASGLMSLGAGLIKAGGPSEFKNNFSGVGDAIMGGLDAYHKSTTQALTNQFLRGQISKQQLDSLMGVAQTIGSLTWSHSPIPPALQKIADQYGITPPPSPGSTAQGGLLSPGSDAPPLPGAPPPPPTGMPPAPGPAMASTGGGSILPFPPGSPPPQIMGGGGGGGGAPPPAPVPGAQMAFNDRIPPNGGMPSGPPPGLLTPPPRPQGAPGMPPGMLSAGGLQPSPAPVQPPPPAMPSRGIADQISIPDRQAMTFAPKAAQDIVKAVISKNLEMTNEGKNARDPAVIPAAAALESAKAGATADAKMSDTIYKGLTGTATIAAQQQQNLAVLRQIAASPNFTPGAGSDLALSMQRMAAQFGINPNGAAPRELFNQIAARVLADQMSGIKSMASETGEAGGRIFKPMLDIEEKANITPSDSLAGINAKINMLDSAGKLMMKWGNMADDYKLAHGPLGPAFYKDLRQQVSNARLGDMLPATPAKGPPVGHVHNGFTFKGGDANEKANWQAVQ